MSFLVSPGVHVKEIDLTNVVPAVDTTIGAIAGPFQKGPVSSITTITSENDLVTIFGKPQGDNFEWWYTAANFLKYSNQIEVVRTESAIVNAGANSGVLIRDTDHYLASFSTGQGSHGEWTARTAGTWANGIKVEICATADAYEQNLSSNNQVNGAASAGAETVTVDDADASGYAFNVGDLVSFYSDSSGTVTIDDFNEYEVTAINTSTNVLSIRLKDDPQGQGLQNAIADDSYIRRRWKYYDLFGEGAPGTSQWATDNARGSGDELHVVVADGTGDITGYDTDSAGNRTRGVIETFGSMSKNPIAKDSTGSSNYYPDVIYRGSQFIYWTDHISAGSNWGSDTTTTYTSVVPITIDTLTGGTDD